MKELSEAEAEIKYAIGRTCIQNYVRLYKETSGISIRRRKRTSTDTILYSPVETALPAYEAMTKEELINELIKAKANEVWAKKVQSERSWCKQGVRFFKQEEF